MYARPFISESALLQGSAVNHNVCKGREKKKEKKSQRSLAQLFGVRSKTSDARNCLQFSEMQMRGQPPPSANGIQNVRRFSTQRSPERFRGSFKIAGRVVVITGVG